MFFPVLLILASMWTSSDGKIANIYSISQIFIAQLSPSSSRCPFLSDEGREAVCLSIHDEGRGRSLRLPALQRQILLCHQPDEGSQVCKLGLLQEG
jgi:hypothetical protein